MKVECGKRWSIETKEDLRAAQAALEKMMIDLWTCGGDTFHDTLEIRFQQQAILEQAEEKGLI